MFRDKGNYISERTGGHREILTNEDLEEIVRFTKMKRNKNQQV